MRTSVAFGVLAVSGVLACADDGQDGTTSTSSSGGSGASTNTAGSGQGGDGAASPAGGGGAGGVTGGGGAGGGAALLTPVFFSDWRTAALGTANADVQDGGKWDTILGNDLGEIIDAPAGFPTHHALLVEYKAVNFLNMRKNGLPVPGVGTTRNYRFYWRHDQPDWPTDNNQHPVQDGNAGSQCSWTFGTNTTSNTTWRARFYNQINSMENPFELNSFFVPELSSGTVYRFDLQIHRTGDTTFQMHAQVHDEDDTLLHDDADFTNEDASGSVSLADAPTFNFHATLGASTLDGLNAGVNGITDVTQDGFPYAVQAAFAVVDGLPVGTFIGPYGTVDGEVLP